MRSITVIVEAGLQEPRDDLDGRTPWQTARCECAAQWARRGSAGSLALAQHAPYAWNVLLGVLSGVPADEAAHVRTGPLAAAALGWDAGDCGWVFCADLVTQDEGVVIQAPARDVTWAETRALAEALAALDGDTVRVEALSPGRFGVGFRAGGTGWPAGLPVWFAAGESMASALMPGKSVRRLRAWLSAAEALLAGHAINAVRIDLDQNPLNGLWLWGGGDPARTRAALNGGAGDAWWSDDPLAAGMGRWRGAALRAGPLPSAQDGAYVWPDGWQDALRAAPRTVLYVRDGGTAGDPSGVERVRRLEALDRQILQPLSGWLLNQPDCRLLWVVAADAVALGLAHRPRLPFVLYPSGAEAPGGDGKVLELEAIAGRLMEG